MHQRFRGAWCCGHRGEHISWKWNHKALPKTLVHTSQPKLRHIGQDHGLKYTKSLRFHTKKTKLRGLRPRANCTDRRLSAKLVTTFVNRGYRVVSATDSYGRILGFLVRSRYFFFQIAPQLYSRGWVDPVPDTLTPGSGALLERSLVVWTLDSFPAFYETRRFNTEFTRALHLSLSWARPIQSKLPHPDSKRFILILSNHLNLGLSSGLLPSGFPTNNLYPFLFSQVRGDEGLLAARPTSKLEDHPLSSVRGSLFNAFTANLHWRPSLYPRPEDAPPNMVPDPLLLRICSSAGNRTRNFGSVAVNTGLYTTEAVNLCSHVLCKTDRNYKLM
jgi:hypothetical protein